MNVAVIIPSYNEEKYIRVCVMSVVNSDYKEGALEIYIVDGESTDQTQAIVAEISAQHPNVKLVNNPQKVTPVALNLGLKATNADVKIILGAHSEVAPDFVSANVNVLRQQADAGCVGGVLENVYETKMAEIIGKGMSSPFGVGNASFRTGAEDGFVDTVAFGAYRKEVFEQIGYFDEDLVRNQDDEYNYRVLSAGFKIYLSNSINVKYFVRGNYSKLWRQYYQYGYWKVYVNKKVRAVTTIRQLFPSALVLFMVVGAGLAPLHGALLFFYALGFDAYLILAFVFAFKKCNGFKELFPIVLTFIILHFSYGIGYWKGILDFMILGKGPSSKSQEVTR